MRWHKAAIGWAVILAAGTIALVSSASAQTFDSYRCADGTHFILAFYPSDKRAYLQIDGRAITLKKSLAVSGRRYSGSGVSIAVTATGAMIKHVRRPATACELS
jgi:membrane-bound inhibitor of C-type lysozyme